MQTNIRMIKILQYLEANKQTSYKEISSALFLNESIVRYEIDNLNFYLKHLKEPLINKKEEGLLVFNQVDTQKIMRQLLELYKPSKEERIEYLTYKLLNDAHLNVTREMEHLFASRNTIKNDLLIIYDSLRTGTMSRKRTV